jgi:DNA-binding PadR family transcriptional regulator
MANALSVGTVMILHALARGHGYGFDLIEQTGLTSGTVYPALERLERSDLARSRWEDARVAHREKRPPRRYFEITTAGKRALAEALERYRALAPITIDGVAYPRRAAGVDPA